MSSTQFDTLINAGGYPKIADYLHAAFPGTIVAAIGQKNYAVHTMGGPGADMRITFGSRVADCDAATRPSTTPGGSRRASTSRRTSTARCATASTSTPTAPWTTAPPTCRRPGCTRSRATATWPAARCVTPDGVRHEGGDAWVTDAAFAVMDNEDWSGLLLTYGGIDKAGHMWGGLNDRPPYPGGDDHTHMAAAAKAADDQIGRVVQKLKDEGLLDETLIVLTTDHAQQTTRALLRCRRVRLARSGQPQLVLRRRRRRDLPRPVTGDPAAGRRDRQRRDEHAGLGDPDLAGRPVAARRSATPPG